MHAYQSGLSDVEFTGVWAIVAYRILQMSRTTGLGEPYSYVSELVHIIYVSVLDHFRLGV